MSGFHWIRVILRFKLLPVRIIQIQSCASEIRWFLVSTYRRQAVDLMRRYVFDICIMLQRISIGPFGNVAY